MEGEKISCPKCGSNDYKFIEETTICICNNCKVKILLFHKENPTIQDLINEEISQKDIERFFYEMDENWRKFSKIAEKHENIEVKRLLKGTMTHSKYINDNYGYYIPFFYSKRSDITPLWKVKKEIYFYEVLIEDFNYLWQLSE